MNGKAFLVWWLTFLNVACSSPTFPPITTVAIRSVKYVRVSPVLRTSVIRPVLINITLPNRSGTTSFQPMRMDDSTFVSTYPDFLAHVSIDAEMTMFVIDDAVSPQDLFPPAWIARDLYVNDTHIAVRQEGANEIGFFRLTKDGVVY